MKNILAVHQEPKNDRSIIFSDNKKSLEYAFEHSLLNKEVFCVKCNSTMKIYAKKEYLNGVKYMCTNKNCAATKSLLFDTKISGLKLEMQNVYYCIYKWIENVCQKDILRNAGCSKGTFQKLKSLIYMFINECNSEQPKLGGKGMEFRLIRL